MDNTIQDGIYSNLTIGVYSPEFVYENLKKYYTKNIDNNINSKDIDIQILSDFNNSFLFN